jgi:surfactin synthase thioesterase subunit
MRLVCFTNAGNEENVFTNEGLGARRVAVLLEWCRANAVELLAVQLPGRGARTKEAFLPDTQARACAALPLPRPRCARADASCVLPRSVGRLLPRTWCACWRRA